MKTAKKVTEFAYYAVNPGFNPLDQSTDEGKLFTRVVDTALSQPGATRAYYGFEVENPAHFWLFLDWDSVEDHMKYRETKAHDAIIEHLEPLLDFSKGFMKHIIPHPYPPVKVLDNTQSPITEVLCAVFPPDIDASSKDTAVARLGEFTEKALKAYPDFRGISYGWSVEDDVPVKGDEEKKGVMLAALIGWPSLEAHMRFRNTPQFKETIGLLRTMPGLIKLGAFHVSCTSKTAEN